MTKLPPGYGPAAECPPPDAPCADCGRAECVCVHACPICDEPTTDAGAWCPACQAGNDYLAELSERDFVRLGRLLHHANIDYATLRDLLGIWARAHEQPRQHDTRTAHQKRISAAMRVHWLNRRIGKLAKENDQNG